MDHPHASHLKILGIVHLIFGALSMVVALGLGFLFLVGAGAAASQSGHDPDAAAAAGVLGVLGIVVAGIVGVMALPQLLGGWGLLKGRGWAKVVILILSALALLNVPLGTALGIYGFWALLHEDADAAMASLNPNTRLYS